ncbi:SBBP repeat-containing protein [Hymenobacter sp. BT188]|uniref:SBBP repeat-containing protein n=1 Tax=Hymenobacter sp. BT188 TaxID=2763504 RepID=UPI0016515902|nr:SBBP repeat-containing protein [Hymenobacter sp. BT188]MBC6607565.1 SBBP repeat-containing protein [Hymenobacter sp. BT188]
MAAWVSRYDGPIHSTDEGRDIAVDLAGNVYITGYTVNSSAFNAEGMFTDMLTIKLDRRTGQPLWVARYNGPANKLDLAYAITVDLVGNVYVAGVSSDGNDEDLVTIRYDQHTGQEKWVARYNGAGNGEETATDIAVDLVGNVYVTGTTTNLSGNSDYLTLKYEPRRGRQVWAAVYNGPANGQDRAWALAVDLAGNAYVTGASYSDTDGDFTTIKYDGRTGQSRWVARYNGPANDYDAGWDIALDLAGNAYVTGFSPHTGENIATLKYDGRTGQQLWLARYSGTANRAGASGIAVDLAGNAYVTGFSFNGTTYEIVTLKYDGRTGQERWVARYNSLETSSPEDIAVDFYGNVYVTGSGMDPQTGNVDYLTLQYDQQSGQLGWQARYDGPTGAEGVPVAMAVDIHGNTYVTGYLRDPGTDFDVATIKYLREPSSCLTATSSNLSSLAGQSDAAPRLPVKAFPNPARDHTSLQFQRTSAAPVQLLVYNARGSLVQTHDLGLATATGVQTVPLSTTDLPSGVYLCRLVQGKTTETIRIVVQK